MVFTVLNVSKHVTLPVIRAKASKYYSGNLSCFIIFYYISITFGHWTLIEYSYFEKGCRKKMCKRQSQKILWYGIWSIHALFLTTVGFEPAFVAFLYSTSKHMPVAVPCHSFKFLWRTVHSKPPAIPFGIVACTFSNNLSRNSYIRLNLNTIHYLYHALLFQCVFFRRIQPSPCSSPFVGYLATSKCEWNMSLVYCVVQPSFHTSRLEKAVFINHNFACIS